MKYQEQMSGITQQMMQQNPQAAGNPSMVEMAMAEAAQQVMNANQAMGQAQSPEQQLVALEQAKVELEKQKLQSDTMTNAAELELKNKKLELEENEQIIGMLKTSSTDNFKREKSEADRSSKEKLKEMEIMGKAAIEEFKMDKEDEREVIKVLKDKFESEIKNETELDKQGLDALVKLAIAQQKEMKNDEEG
tara:strand:- start:426 stop:1001 length:576 start_codon:yes stop_codon:yes gene_type:complete